MNTCTVKELGTLQGLIARAQEAEKPVVVFDGEDECLVAMRPSAFERVLLDSDSLARAQRSSLRM